MGYSSPHLGVLSTVSQDIVTPGTPQVITFGTTVLASKIVATTSSRFTVNEAGNYNVQLSLQATTVAGSDDILDVWFRINDVDVPNSNSVINIVNANDRKRLTIAMGVVMTAGQYFEVWMNGNDTDLILEAQAAQVTPDRPVTPSVFLTMDKLP